MKLGVVAAAGGTVAAGPQFIGLFPGRLGRMPVTTSLISGVL